MLTLAMFLSHLDFGDKAFWKTFVIVAVITPIAWAWQQSKGYCKNAELEEDDEIVKLDTSSPPKTEKLLD